MKNIIFVFSENFQFLVMKFSIYLNRHVFVMSGILLYSARQELIFRVVRVT